MTGTGGTGTHRVAAAVSTEIGGQCDSGAEVENHIEQIEGDHGDGNAEAVLDCRRDQVE